MSVEPDPAVPGEAPLVGFGSRSSALLVSLAVAGVGGLLFNALAAQLVDRSILGVQASLFFWVTFVNQLSSLGLPVLVGRLGRWSPRALQLLLLRRTYVVAVVSSVLVAVALMPVALVTTREEVRSALRDSLLLGVSLIVVLLAGFAVTLLVEIRAMSLGLGRYVVARTLVVNVLRCGLLAVPSLRDGPLALLALNAGINAVVGLVAAALLWVHERRTTEAVPVSSGAWRSETRFAVTVWLGSIALIAAQYGFPLLADVPIAENAVFYLVWQVTAMVFVVPVTIGHVVIAEASRGARAESAFRRGMWWSLVICGVIGGAAVVAGEPLARLVFGRGYGEVGTVLPWMLFAAVPWSLISLRIAQYRAVGDGRASVVTTVVYGVVLSVLVVVLRDGTAIRTAQIWFVSHVVLGVVVALASSERARGRRWALTPPS